MTENLEEKAKQLFTQANETFDRPTLANWLSFCFGVMSRRVTDTDLVTMETELRGTLSAFKTRNVSPQ